MSRGPYSRVYHRLMTEYPSVWRSPAQLGLFVQLLVAAEKFYPQPAPILHRNRHFRALLETGLIIEHAGDGYSIRGLEAERERRSAPGRYAAGVRWQSERNASAMLEEKEKRREEKDGQSPTTFMGFKPRLRPNLADIERQHAASMEDAIRKTREREVGE